MTLQVVGSDVKAGRHVGRQADRRQTGREMKHACRHAGRQTKVGWRKQADEGGQANAGRGRQARAKHKSLM